MFEHCTLTIVFNFNPLNDQNMSVDIDYAGQKDSIAGHSGRYIYTRCIELPAVLDLTFSGKNSTVDTLVDDQGNIVQDKSVVIEDMMLDRLPISKYYLESNLNLIADNQQVIDSNYIGFNGHMKLEFNKPNVFLQMMEIGRAY